MNHDLKTKSYFFATVLQYYSIFFKDEYFKQEEEWRIVCKMGWDLEKNKIIVPNTLNFRIKNQRLIPYIKETFGNDLPIQKIIVGPPKTNFQVNELAVTLLLERNDFSIKENDITKIEIISSEIPYVN